VRRLSTPSKAQARIYTLLSGAMALYFLLRLVYDLISGSAAWPVNVFGIGGGLAVAALIQHAAAHWHLNDEEREDASG
jgi:membrane associated rhomboid family serine protease